MNKQIRKLIADENPSHVIDFGDIEIRLYDVSKGGVNGWQKLAVIFDYPNEPLTYRTTGGGYCKTNHALEWVFNKLGKRPCGFINGGGLHQRFKVGGNFYLVDNESIVDYV